MSKSTREYLRHILREIDFLIGEADNLSLAELVQDETRMRAFARSLEIIGEAAKKVPGDYRGSHEDIDWRGMAGMRDRLIHQYFEVDYEIVWDVVVNELPGLKEKLTSLVGE